MEFIGAEAKTIFGSQRLNRVHCLFLFVINPYSKVMDMAGLSGKKEMDKLIVTPHCKFSFAVLHDAISITRKDAYFAERVLYDCSPMYFVLWSNSNQ